ncbi:MAG: DUF4342 domain-containing protein [bacterium]|nr:DUF4342 domain-containing protein [bacterium]
MTDANPNPHANDRTAPPAWRATLGRLWRAGQERSLVIRRREVDLIRLPLNLGVLFTLVLAAWSWPVLVLAVLAALVTQVEFVVQRDSAG